MSYIDCHDIAASAAALLTGAGHNGETFILTGPEALTHAAIARKLSAALGRTVRSVAMAPAQLAAMLMAQGLPSEFADDIAVLSAEVAAGAMATTTSAVRDLTGRSPRTFGQFTADNRRALHSVWRQGAGASLPAEPGTGHIR